MRWTRRIVFCAGDERGMRMKRRLWITITGAILMSTLTAGGAAEKSGSTRKSSFGRTPDGEQVDLYLLTNKNGVEAAISTYGGVVVSLKVPDRNGKLADVVLGYDTLEGYQTDKVYFGAIVGRYANRIAHAHFTLNVTTYTLAKNNGENTLHGGLRGFNKKVWTAKAIPGKDGQALGLFYISNDGEGGFSANLQ